MSSNPRGPAGGQRDSAKLLRVGRAGSLVVGHAGAGRRRARARREEKTGNRSEQCGDDEFFHRTYGQAPSVVGPNENCKLLKSAVSRSKRSAFALRVVVRDARLRVVLRNARVRLQHPAGALRFRALVFVAGRSFRLPFFFRGCHGAKRVRTPDDLQ